MIRKFKIALFVFASLFVLSLSLGPIHPVSALNPVSTLYLTPNSTGPRTIGTTLTLNITGDLLGSSATSGINGWDLVFTDNDPTFANLNPVSISIAGNFLAQFGQVSEQINCVNAGSGVTTGQPGNVGCDIRDGPGIVHTTAIFNGPATPTPISGLVAQVVYSVTGNGEDLINIESPCASTTQPCDQLVDGSPTPVPHITLGADIQTVANDFDVTSRSTAFNPGSTGTSMFTIQGLNAYSAAQTITTDTYPLTGLTTSCGAITPSPVTSVANSTSTCTFTSKTPGIYVVTASVTDGTLTHLAPMTVKVGDFATNVPTIAVNFPTTNPGTAAISVTSINGFSGTVVISRTVTPATGLTVTCPTSLSTSPGVAGSGSCTLASSIPGTYSVSVNGTFVFTGGKITHISPFTVNVQDFSITTVSAQPVVMASGASGVTASVQVKALFNWNRAVTFTTTSDVTGTTAACGAAVVPSAAGITRACTLTSTTPGAYRVTVTATCVTPTCNPAVAHSTTIDVRVQDISIQYTGVAQPITFTSGGTNSTTFTVSSLPANSAGFAGIVNIASTLNPLTGLSATCSPSVTLTAGATSPQQTCTFNSSTPGTYTVTLNATALITAGQSVKHVITITVIVKPAAVSHATTTTISCHPATFVVNNSTSCLVTVTDIAAGPTTPSGTVTFTSSGTGSFTTCTLAGAGASATCTTTYTPTVIGTGSHTLTANYPGDAQNPPHTLSSGNTAVTVTVRTTTTTVVCSPSPVTVNSPTVCTVTVKDTSPGTLITPGGTVTLASNGAGTFTGTCTLSGSLGTATCQETYTPSGTAPRTDTITATFPADSTHSTSQGTFQLPVTAQAAHATTTTISCHPTTIVVNNVTSCLVTVTDIATGPTTPTGTVSISTSGTGTFNQACILSGTGASATCSFTYTPTVVGTGTHTLTANYPGDAQTPAHTSSSNTTNITVTVRSTTTTITCHPTTIVVSNSTSCTVTVTDTSPGTASTPTGSISLSSSGTGTFSTCTFTGGSCTVTYTPTVIGTGTHTLTATYNGDASHGTSQGTTRITITQRSTTTSVVCTPSPVAVTASATCTATVQDNSPGTAITPSGTVAFTNNATAGSFALVGSPCTLGGTGATATCQVTYTTSGAAPRHDLITGTYSGDANHSAGTPGTFLLAVTAQAAHATTTTITCHPTAIVVNNVTNCKVTVADISTGPTTPTSTVSFSSSGTGTITGTCNLAGTGASATCSVTYTPTVVGTGAHTLTATYGGDSTHATSQGTANITVQKRNTTASVSCSPSLVAINQTTTCTTNVQDTSPGTFITPTGTVTFTSSAASGVFTGTCTVNGSTATATCTTIYVQKTTAGSTTITANYVGDTNHNAAAAATTTVTTTLRTTSTTIACTPSSVNVGQQTKCTATVADASPGTASTPTGNVSFSSNSTGTFTPTSCALTAGSCSVMFTAPTTRGHSAITGNYSPSDTSHSASSGSFLLAVNVLHATTTSVSCSPTSVAVNVPTTCSATVTDTTTTGAITPTGTVAFSSSGTGGFSTGMCTLSGTGTSASCTASVTYTPAAVGTGTHMITGTYSGDVGHNPSNGTFPLTVTLRTTSTTVSCAPTSLPIGQASTCTATVADTSPAPASTPTGTVTFTSTGGAGTFSSTNCTLSGGKCSVMFAPTTTAVSSISASYGGDATHSGSSTATAATVTGVLATFTITATSPSSVPVGTSATSTITITAQSGGFTGTVSLSDNPLPTGLTCQTLNPMSVTLPPSPSTALLSCTSTTPAAYTVTITAASGSLTQTAKVTFTFTPISQKDFALSISPTSITLDEDSFGHSFVILHSNGFNGTVDLSVKISPTGLGLTARLVRVQVRLNQTSSQRILLVVSGDEAKAGDYTVTVTGTSGTLSHSASLKVTVVHPGDDQRESLQQFLAWFYLQVATSRWD